MPFVLDASVTVTWAYSDQVNPFASLMIERIQNDEALTPAIWWYEVRNALIKSERGGLLESEATARFLRLLSRFRIRIDFQHDEARLLALTRGRRLSVYDASYLELAQRTGLALATLDQALQRAARAEGVTLLQSSANGG